MTVVTGHEMEWKPIKTAPQDGDWFLGFDENRLGGWGIVAARFVYFGSDDCEIQCSQIGSGDFVQGANITHWMPLPKPPKLTGRM